MNQIGVIHLARAQNGLKPFEDFLRSYRQHSAGVAHDLVVIFKGFGSKEAAAPWEKAASDIPHKTIFISDLGFDLRAYRLAAEQVENPFVYFLNSFSEILSDGWLEKTFVLIQRDGVGIVGATGSWESMYSNATRDFERIAHIAFGRRLSGLARVKACQICFNAFPNYHVRTNAFMMSRDVMLKLWPRYIFTKRSAYLFENGKNGLTNRILKLGLHALVVGKDGVGYDKESWVRSNTFRKLDQQNLLVADNQTRLYQNADEQNRIRLSALAWGERAQTLP